MKLNIAFYTDTYEPAVDGVVNSINNFKKQLELKGHKVYIFSTSRIGARTKKRNGVFLYSGIEFKPYPQYSLALFPYRSVTTLSRLGIDVIHSHTPFSMGFSGLVNARLLKIPIVGSFHTLVSSKSIVKEYYPNNKQLKKFTSEYMQKYIKFFYRRCNATIAPSQVIANMLKKQDIGNVSVVPNMIDRTVFNRKNGGNGFRMKHGIRSDDKMVLYVGRLSKEKRLDVMIKAAALLKNKNRKFVIGGSGPAESYYKNMAMRMGLDNVIFTGFISQKELPSAYASCDVFCMPSTFETQGIVALEAMSTGKPVVGADYMALRELIENGINGEKFRSGDYTQCSRKIEKVLNDEGKYTDGAIETATRFSPKNVTDRLMDVYKSVL